MAMNLGKQWAIRSFDTLQVSVNIQSTITKIKIKAKYRVYNQATEIHLGSGNA